MLMTAVYIPLQGNTRHALSELYWLITSHENTHIDVLFIVSVDFNQADFSRVYPITTSMSLAPLMEIRPSTTAL